MMPDLSGVFRIKNLLEKVKKEGLTSIDSSLFEMYRDDADIILFDKNDVWHAKGLALFRPRKFQEAINAFNRAISMEAQNYHFFKKKGEAAQKTRVKAWRSPAKDFYGQVITT